MPKAFSIRELPFQNDPAEIFELFKDCQYSFFLDSAYYNSTLGRFSFLGFNPKVVFKSKNNLIEINNLDKKTSFTGNPFRELKRLLSEFSVTEKNEFGIPFLGGAVGYFGYELKNFLEDLSQTASDDLKIPDCIIGFYENIIVFDNLKKRQFLASFKSSPEKEIKFIEDALKSFRPKKNNFRISPQKITAQGTFFEPNFTKDNYFKAIERIKEYIKCGDIYQVNLSQRFSGPWSGDEFKLYRFLRFINPAPMASFLNFEDVCIVSASPERFLKLEGNIVETRPIKGTRPRGRSKEEDLNFKKELLNSAKDRAEHLMIVDLERNDLGRCCEYNSVEVRRFMGIEEYSTVWHLVSTICGRLKKGLNALDLLECTFPGGSITGAPKIRSMEIADELEPTVRSVYTGAIGYIGFDGNTDLSIPIRTILIKNGKFYFSVGGGIVYDSDAEAEYNETLDKAKALILAINRINKAREKNFISKKDEKEKVLIQV